MRRTWKLLGTLIAISASAQVAFSQAPVDFGEIEFDPFTSALGTDVADMDGDGDMDVLFAVESGWMSWFENTAGDGSEFTEHVVQMDGDTDGRWWQSWSVFAADIDGDGDNDIVGGTGRYENGLAKYELNYWRNDGGSFSRQFIGIGNPNDSLELVLYWAEPGDVDGDGDLDIAVCDYDTIMWYENSGGGGFSDHVIDDTFLGVRGAHFADIDGDGIKEVIGASYYLEEVAVFDAYTYFKITQFTVPGAFGVTSLDGDGDGDIDLAVSGNGYGAYYIENSAGSLSLSTVDIMGGGYSILPADLDGDGDQDLVCVGTGTWYENDGTGTGWSVWSLPVIDGWDAGIGDIDGDGDLDISVSPFGGYSGRLLWLGNGEAGSNYDPYGSGYPYGGP